MSRNPLGVERLVSRALLLIEYSAHMSWKAKLARAQDERERVAMQNIRPAVCDRVPRRVPCRPLTTHSGWYCTRPPPRTYHSRWSRTDGGVASGSAAFAQMRCVTPAQRAACRLIGAVGGEATGRRSRRRDIRRRLNGRLAGVCTSRDQPRWAERHSGLSLGQATKRDASPARGVPRT